MHALAKMAEMALNCQNCPTVNKNSNDRQTVNKNSNEMAVVKGVDMDSNQSQSSILLFKI